MAVQTKQISQKTPGQAVSRRPPQEPPEDLDSGQYEGGLLDLQPGSRVTRAELSVSGKTFHGKIKNLEGAKISESPVVFTATGKQATDAQTKAYIVDFGRIVSVMKLEMPVSGPAITMVLPWLGTDFSPTPSFGNPPSGAGKAPTPDTTGESTVGLTGVETLKLLVQLKGSNLPSVSDFPSQCTITTGTYPTNVKASLNGRLPFWTKPGPLSDPAKPTGLVEDLNAIAAEATETITVQLSLATDTPGVLAVDFDEGTDSDVERSARARWGGQSTTQIALQALDPQTVPVPFPAGSSATWNVSGLEISATGNFPPWRAYPGQATTEPGKLGLKIDATFGVARRFELPETADVYGLALLLRPLADDAQIHLELAAEDADAPAAGKPLASADLSITAGSAGAAAFWQEVLFPAAVSLKPEAGTWVVARAPAGALEWAGAPEHGSPEVRTLLSSSGSRWDRYPAVDGLSPVAQMRILRRPFPSENDPVLELEWADGVGGSVAAEVGQDPVDLELKRPDGQPLTVPVAAGAASVALSVTAGATGTLTLIQVTALYREAEE